MLCFSSILVDIILSNSHFTVVSHVIGAVLHFRFNFIGFYIFCIVFSLILQLICIGQMASLISDYYHTMISMLPFATSQLQWLWHESWTNENYCLLWPFLGGKLWERQKTQNATSSLQRARSLWQKILPVLRLDILATIPYKDPRINQKETENS